MIIKIATDNRSKTFVLGYLMMCDIHLEYHGRKRIVAKSVFHLFLQQSFPTKVNSNKTEKVSKTNTDIRMPCETFIPSKFVRKNL